MTIQTPGKFEGCPEWAPKFWDDSLDNLAERDFISTDGTIVFELKVYQEDVAQYPSLTNNSLVWLWEDEQGFIHATTNPEAVPKED